MITSQIPAWLLDMSKLHPIDDRVLLERVELPSSGTLILPSEPPLHRGRVVRVGPGKRFGDGTRRPMQVNPGDMVRYQSADIDTGTHVLIQEGDILFVES